MKLVRVQIDLIRVGQPLPFALRDASGVLLAPIGYVVEKYADLDLMVTQRGRLYIDITESEGHHRAYVEKLHTLVREDQSLGIISETGIAMSGLPGLKTTVDMGEPDWVFLQTQAAGMLVESNPANFVARLDKLYTQLEWHLRNNPDGVLFALFHLTASEMRHYSATHAMLVSMMCSLAASQVFNWPAETIHTLGKAALTMNLGMTELQDRLVLQGAAPSALQRKQINGHAKLSADMLEKLGITDPIWLEAVTNHHTQLPGPVSGRTPGMQLARLIQRADMFAACLAPRATRAAVASAVAMKGSYFDENKQIDEAGAALIKVVGVYSPGSYVRLATNEIAVVIRRGVNTATPKVAVLVSRSGMPTLEHMVRDTSQAEFKITASVLHRDVKVQINLPKMLALTKPALSGWPR